MAKLPILIWPDPVLQQVSKRAEMGVAQFVRDLAETAVAANGAGISAIQVGVPERLMLVKMDADFLTMYNPKLLAKQGGTALMSEGCLSVPGFTEQVRRYKQVTVRFMNILGIWGTMTLNGRPAQCVQHELEHLDGHIFLEKLSRARREVIEAELAAIETARRNKC